MGLRPKPRKLFEKSLIKNFNYTPWISAAKLKFIEPPNTALIKTAPPPNGESAVLYILKISNAHKVDIGHPLFREQAIG